MHLTYLPKRLTLNLVRYVPTFHILHVHRMYSYMMNRISGYTLHGTHRYMQVYDERTDDHMLHMVLKSGYPHHRLRTTPRKLQSLTDLFVNVAYYGRVEHMKLLLEHGADVNKQDNHDNTALIKASLKGQRECVDILLAHGADVDTQNGNGHTALMVACCWPYRGCLESLLDHGVSIDIQNDYGQTALMIACTEGSVQSVKLLLDHGADIFIKDRYRHSVLDAAKIHRRKECIRVLEEFIASRIADLQGLLRP